MLYQHVKGMDDILPSGIKAWHKIESIARNCLESYGFSEIRTPLLEDTSVFIRGIGEGTDIVTKEMFTFQDKGEKSLTLRPEGTASIVRAYIEHSMQENAADMRLYYIGPMFRRERPQKGRLRQFHQIGVEVIGSDSPYADAEVIAQISKMLSKFGLTDFNIKINSLGCKNDKEKFADSLRRFLSDKESRLCEDCKVRVKKNVLRVLDCKKESCQVLLNSAPKVLQNICSDCNNHFETVKKVLNTLGVKYTVCDNLVRGLDYYTRTVFEITHGGLGSQDAIGAGGRYDNLIKDFGGPLTGAIGYAVGVERILLALSEKQITDEHLVIAIATLGDEAKIAGVKLADKIREGTKAVVCSDIKGASLKSQFRAYDKLGAKFVLIIGEDEIKKGVVVLRNMFTKEQLEVEKNMVLEVLKNRLKEG